MCFLCYIYNICHIGLLSLHCCTFWNHQPVGPGGMSLSRSKQIVPPVDDHVPLVFNPNMITHAEAVAE